jgi:hypothetical protein
MFKPSRSRLSKYLTKAITTFILTGFFMITCYAQQNKPDLFIGDWQTVGSKFFAQVYLSKEGVYKANITTNITSLQAPLTVLTAEKATDGLNFTGDGWAGKMDNKRFDISHGTEKLMLSHFTRTSPTMNAPAPKGAIVLFNGKNLDAWSKVEEKEWLNGSGPVDNWKILPGGILEVVPHQAPLYESIITKQKFGDIKLHLEFRLLGEVTNGGVYFMSRYEMNIKDAYGQIGGTPVAFGNVILPKSMDLNVNVAYPPMQWQTFDVDFRAPRFDSTGTRKIENARITVVHNGVTVYNDVEIKAVKGSTAKLGEAGVGPIYLQEHGSAYQFRNIWVIDKTVKRTENAYTSAIAQATTEPGAKKHGGGKRKATEAGASTAAGDTTAAVSGDVAVKKHGSGKRKATGVAAGDSTTSLSADVVVKKHGGGKRKAASQESSTTDTVKRTGGKKIDANYDGELNPAYAATTVILTADPSGKPAKTAGFIHPGILVNGAQLTEIKRRVQTGVDPQKSAFQVLKASPLGARDYVPHPVEAVLCGPKSNPDVGCKIEQADCEAAYSQALLWSITGDKVYAENAIKIMNAWSYMFTGGHGYANGPVQAAWCGSVWPRAAEIIRYTYTGWSDADVAKFQNMLRVQYLPFIIHGDCENGNKELAMSEALINIGVFNDDRAVFDLGLKMWRARTPAYIYLKTDGPQPIQPPGCGVAIWGNKGLTPTFVDGILQETARDAHHPGLAFASMANAAETARQQGVDLYGEEGKRMMAALEFQAQYLPPNNAPKPPNLEFSRMQTWEIAYNQFHDRMGYSLPKMAAVLPTNRPTGADHHMVWETLTHAGMGNIGLPPLIKNDKQ